MKGRVDNAGRALIEIALRKSVEREWTQVEAWIDTGFTGDLVMPISSIERLGLELSGSVDAILADGSQIALSTYTCIIEWFGGTVNVKNAVIWNVGDDAVDTDQSWSGVLDNFVIFAPADHNFELDGPEGSYKAGHIIQNGTVVASDPSLGRSSSDLINTDDNSIVILRNIYFTAIEEGQQINRVEFTEGEVQYEGIELNVPAENLESHVAGEVPEGVTAVSAPTVGADLSGFNWTWAAIAGKLAEI